MAFQSGLNGDDLLVRTYADTAMYYDFMTNLEGKVALITGAGSGIGAHTARSLSKAGCNIILCGRRETLLQEVARGLDGPSLALSCDVKDQLQVEKSVQDGISKFGQIDILINNAGIFAPASFEALSVDQWDDVLDTNLRGSFLFAKSSWDALKKTSGQIVNISSVAGKQGFAHSSAYCASKFGLNGLSEVLALEGKPYGVRVFCVCPGSIETPLWEPYSTEGERSKMMRPETIADLVTWLVSSTRSIEVGPIVVNNFKSPFTTG